MGLVLADRHDRIRNSATNTAALWLLESGISVRRPEEKSICDSPVGAGAPPILIWRRPAFPSGLLACHPGAPQIKPDPPSPQEPLCRRPLAFPCLARLPPPALLERCPLIRHSHLLPAFPGRRPPALLGRLARKRLCRQPPAFPGPLPPALPGCPAMKRLCQGAPAFPGRRPS